MPCKIFPEEAPCSVSDEPSVYLYSTCKESMAPKKKSTSRGDQRVQCACLTLQNNQCSRKESEPNKKYCTQHKDCKRPLRPSSGSPRRRIRGKTTPTSPRSLVPYKNPNALHPMPVRNTGPTSRRLKSPANYENVHRQGYPPEVKSFEEKNCIAMLCQEFEGNDSELKKCLSNCEQWKKNYIRLSLQYHPDKGGKKGSVADMIKLSTCNDRLNKLSKKIKSCISATESNSHGGGREKS